MTVERDPYADLSLDRDATPAEINHAYRGLLLRHHPDTRTLPPSQPAAAADVTLQRVLAAYALLHDPARRADYDHRAAATAAHRPPNVVDTRLANGPTDHRRPGPPTIQVGPVRWHARPRSDAVDPRDPLLELLTELQGWTWP